MLLPYVKFWGKILIHWSQSIPCWTCATHNSYSSLTSSLSFTFSILSYTHCHSLWSLLFPYISPYLSLFSLFSQFLFPFVTKFFEFWAIFSFFSKQFLAWWIPIWTTAEVQSFSHIKAQQKRKEKNRKNEWSKKWKFANIVLYG